MKIRFYESNFLNLHQRHAAQLILDVTYGISISSREDSLVGTAEAVMRAISIAISPLMWILNPIPLCEYLQFHS